MSSISIILIFLINHISKIISINQCDSLSSIDLQSATYTHSVILHVQPIYSSNDENDKNNIIRKVLVREVIKLSKISLNQIKINDMIIIRIDNDLEEILDDSCWQLLRITNIDIIIFLNDTNTNQFDLRYPPVESTLRVRQNIDAVINYETYSPQVIIKTRIDKAISSNEYSLQCNSRGNPLPRLLWSKDNQTLEYYPSDKQCKTPCRIYSIQNKYQSTLYFQPITNIDSGVYVCHAENAINRTMANVYIDVDQNNIISRSDLNMTCASLKFCHDRGQCIIVDNQLKCFCDNRYFGEQCETNYDDIIKKQYNAILLFKSRFLAGCIIIVVGFILLLIAFISCFLARNNKSKQQKVLISKPNVNEIQQKVSSPPPPPTVRIVTKNRSILTKELSTATDDNENCKNLNGYCVTSEINTEQSPLKTNKTAQVDSESKANHLILSEGYLEFYQPDAESGLIRPLSIRTDIPKRHTKYVSSPNRFLLPRPVNQ